MLCQLGKKLVEHESTQVEQQFTRCVYFLGLVSIHQTSKTHLYVHQLDHYVYFRLF